MGLTGIVLAAGAGTRAGGPKALSRTADGEPWLTLAVAVLQSAGCDRVVVVLGAEAERAAELVPDGVETVVAEDWEVGMSASLRAGLAAARDGDAALIALVDLPNLPAAVARRVVGDWAADAEGRSVLKRAGHWGRPGHPVLIGADHWGAFVDSLDGDRGGQVYLEQHGVRLIECGDLFDGHDVDS
jgi:CTP:molybdopterin cytidylyltransferase MocA